MRDIASQTMVITGQDCPCSGVWQALASGLPPITVRQGDIMPAAHGRVATWELVWAEVPQQSPALNPGQG